MAIHVEKSAPLFNTLFSNLGNTRNEILSSVAGMLRFSSAYCLEIEDESRVFGCEFSGEHSVLTYLIFPFEVDTGALIGYCNTSFGLIQQDTWKYLATSGKSYIITYLEIRKENEYETDMKVFQCAVANDDEQTFRP